jgi:hypothetical protein
MTTFKTGQADLIGPLPPVGIVPMPQRSFLEAVSHFLAQQDQRTNVSSAATRQPCAHGACFTMPAPRLSGSAMTG